MSSRKEEERNEKIIRGLMKLPPNRRCINCNSLGPQYVCTNFWTFVCMTCSGIHREFTHRVKSVSMAKFTSQEVEALQKSGNQRAREIYLKDWDSQRLRLPDNSNADKIREFINNVYVDKKFVGGKSSERPPRDSQKLSSHEDETRRASSYHSYSQSPPYDFQYEERRYGRHAPVLSRKPGSDRGLYDGKVSSFLSPSRPSDRSPSRLSDQTYADRFAYERSNSRISDYSLSSGGDLFRSGVQSPNYQNDIGTPSSETSRDFSAEDIVNFTGNTNLDSYGGKDCGRVLHPQRTASCGSSGSFDNNSLSFKSINSVSIVDVALEPEQTLEAQYTNTSGSPSLPQSSSPGNSDGLDLFSAPFAPQNNKSTASAIKVTHLPESQSTHSLDLFQSSPASTTTFTSHQLPQTISQSPLELFSVMPQQQPAATFGKKSSDVLVHQNDGWATFDIPRQSAPLVTENSAPATIRSSNNNSVIDPLLSLNEWPSFQDFYAHGPFSSKETPWNEASRNVNTVPYTTSTESWSAFEDSTEQLPFHSVDRSCEQVEKHQPLTSDQYFGLEVTKEMNKDGSHSVAEDSVPPLLNVSSHVLMPPHELSTLPALAGIPSYPVDHKSTNPFDLPYDPEVAFGDTSQFWDMSSLQDALPNGQMPTAIAIGTNQSWFSQDPLPAYVPSVSEGGLGFIAAQASATQISTVPSQGPVASVGGNPFA